MSLFGAMLTGGAVCRGLVNPSYELLWPPPPRLPPPQTCAIRIRTGNNTARAADEPPSHRGRRVPPHELSARFRRRGEVHLHCKTARVLSRHMVDTCETLERPAAARRRRCAHVLVSIPPLGASREHWTAACFQVVVLRAHRDDSRRAVFARVAAAATECPRSLAVRAVRYRGSELLGGSCSSVDLLLGLPPQHRTTCRAQPPAVARTGSRSREYRRPPCICSGQRLI